MPPPCASRALSSRNGSLDGEHSLNGCTTGTRLPNCSTSTADEGQRRGPRPCEGERAWTSRLSLAGGADVTRRKSLGAACLCLLSVRVLTCSCVQKCPQSIHSFPLTSLLLTDVQMCSMVASVLSEKPLLPLPLFHP